MESNQHQLNSPESGQTPIGPRVLVLARKRKERLSPHVIVLGQPEPEQGTLPVIVSMPPEPNLNRWRMFIRRPRATIAASLGVAFTLVTSAAMLSAFEAHVINVTAKIEQPPSFCDARSPGYWRNHEGCAQGTGSSIWTSQINALSATFSGVFAGFTGPMICSAVYTPACGPGNTPAGRFCRTRLQVLADELNVVSDRLDLNALIAFADDGDQAFDRLGLSPTSTVGQALAIFEAILANPGATAQEIRDVRYAADRIHEFYEFENPLWPSCIFDDDQLDFCREQCENGQCRSVRLEVENENEAEVTNDVSVSTDTGGNSASGGGGIIETGDATSTVDIENVVNTNITGSNAASGTAETTAADILGNLTTSTPPTIPAITLPGILSVPGINGQGSGLGRNRGSERLTDEAASTTSTSVPVNSPEPTPPPPPPSTEPPAEPVVE